MVDERLKNAVSNQLAWDPEVDASLVGVTAKEGVLTLSGYVDTYAAKLAAERAARRVYGVKAVANELEVKLAAERIDPDIAKDALDALKNRIDVPLGLGVTVRDGYVTLTGSVGWMITRGCQPNGLSSICAACVEYSTTSLSSRPSLQKTSRSGSSKPCIGMPILTRVASTSRPQGPMSS